MTGPRSLMTDDIHEQPAVLRQMVDAVGPGLVVFLEAGRVKQTEVL